MPAEPADLAIPRPPARTASALLLVANLLFFWPVLFHGRVFSSHGAALAVSPWRDPGAADDPRVRFLADPASGGQPLLRALPAKAFWDAAAGGGSPGAVNVVRGFLSPFAWLPALLLPESAIETGILFLKLNAGFLFLFLFLRERGLSETAASCGAAAWGWSGAQSAWWLWMQSSVTVALPLLLLAIDRSRSESRFDRAAAPATAALLLFLAGGYPFMILYGAAAALVWVGVSSWGRPASENGRMAVHLAVAVLLASAILSPAFRVSARALRASGQFPARSGFAREIRLPPRHALLYAFPFALGDPVADDYRPLTGSRFETFPETAVGVGPAALALALIGAANRRRRRLYAFGAVLAAGTAAALYAPPVRALAESLPVVSAGLLERVKIVAVLGIAVAGAVGAEALEPTVAAAPVRRAVRAFLPFVIGVPLILAAARFYPPVPPRDAVFAPTPGVLALERAAKGGRFLATGWTLYPDLGEPFGLEDVRGHLFFEGDYRRLLSAADARIYGRTGTLLISDPATLDPVSPVLDLLGISAIAAAPGEEGTAAALLPKVYGGPDLSVFRRPTAFPRFFLVGRWEPGGVAEAARASTAALRSAAFVDPRDFGRLPRPAAAADGASIAVEAAGDDAFRLRVRTRSPALLVSSQKLFAPYWTASLDGHRAAPVRVDGLFFGLPVPPGDHVVEGRFRIPRAEAAVSAAGGAALLALAAACVRRVP